MAKWLRKSISAIGVKGTQSPLATSFGDDSFLVTTEGLGFYYYGKGDKKIEHDPFEQVEFDSDRAAGLVSGAIVERRLQEALRSRFHVDNQDISNELFHASGPLGSFKVKIELAYSLGVVSEVAHKDLINLKTSAIGLHTIWSWTRLTPKALKIAARISS